ncbi:hypothetical protein NIES4103_39270 [Nostoc sp. NIES-4103]|nr:hypothetical protein NIES4103_39270 [Nostoc sp. NIES-4103]
MARSSINASHIVLTKEEYYKLKIYAVKHRIKIHQAIGLLINSLAESNQTSKKLSKNYSFMFTRRFLHIYLNVR